MPGRSRKSRTAAAEDGLPDIALSSRQRQALRTALLTWYRRSHRDLPWRRSRDPYAIWISEIMLQQTRVDTVRDYYARFMARFPTISDLAEAPQADVLSLWSGLGYYARARNLHAAAGEIATRYGGQFPREAEAVHALPGIGPYTAGAIRSIAFGQRAPILDGNVTRVLSRLFAIPAGPEQAAAKRLYWRLAEELLPAELAAADADAPNDVGDFNQALMELGATVCTPHRPGCLLCPLSGDCEARARDQQELFPPPKATRPVPVLRAVTAILSPQPGPRDLAVPVLLVRRPGSGLWGGLWEPPSLWLSEATSDQPIRLQAMVELAGDRLVIDFAGSEPQRDNGLNCPIASTISMANYAVKCVVAPGIAQNEGCNRAVEIRVPEGSILNPRRPAAVSVRHLTQQAVAEVLLKAMAPLAPDRAAAGCQISFPTFAAGGFDDRPEKRDEATGEAPYYVISDIIGGGMGGNPVRDGISAVDTHGGNCAILSAEVVETLSPIRVLDTRLVPGSGGAGQHRGGLAMRRDYQFLSKRSIMGAYLQQTSALTSAWGLAGGGPGAPAAILLNPGTPRERKLKSKIYGLALEAGDVMRFQSSGGGGWGDPEARDPALMESDRGEGLA